MKPLLVVLCLLSTFLLTPVLADQPPVATQATVAPTKGVPAEAAPPAAAPSAVAPTAVVPAAAVPAAPVKLPKPAALSRVRVATSMGSFTVELNGERAPITVANFLRYVDEGHYSGTIFHRVVSNFVIQGGGFDANYGPKAAPYKVFNESGNGLSNVRGSVGMARSGDPHGADAQFYVNLYDNAALDPNQTRWGYAVFGRVVEGMEVVDQIGNVPTGARGPLKEDTPLKPVVIERVERVAQP